MNKNTTGIFLYLFLMSCTTHHANTTTDTKFTTAVWVVEDVTDKKTLWGTANPILQLYHCDEHPEAAAWFTLSSLSDKKINSAYSFHLPDAVTTEQRNIHDDPQDRKRQIKNFYEEVRNAFTAFYQQFDTTKAFPNSQCWFCISTAINDLNKLPASRKYLYLFSDLQEHSNIYNCYSNRSKIDLQKTEALFLKADSIPANLQDMTIVFVYLPQTAADDDRYYQMLALYRMILVKRGAKIIIQTNNTYYDVADN